jgi:SAM-dependent methyltransferase
VDVDEASIEHARGRYAGSGVEFTNADALDLPFDDDRFDAVVSFETLEHLSEHEQLLSEFRRVLRPGGFLVISSPDRKTYSDDTGFDNEFHVRELYRDELEALLGRHFPNFRLFGQKLVFHSALWSLDDRSLDDRSLDDRPSNHGAGPPAEHLSADDDGRVERTDRPRPAPLYFVAVASARGIDLPSPPALSLFDDRAESVYAHYNEEVRKHIRAGHLLAERDAEIAALKERRASLGARLKRWLTPRR